MIKIIDKQENASPWNTTYIFELNGERKTKTLSGELIASLEANNIETESFIQEMIDNNIEKDVYASDDEELSPYVFK